jgi:hypothetical protein
VSYRDGFKPVPVVRAWRRGVSVAGTTRANASGRTRTAYDVIGFTEFWVQGRPSVGRRWLVRGRAFLTLDEYRSACCRSEPDIPGALGFRFCQANNCRRRATAVFGFVGVRMVCVAAGGVHSTSVSQDGDVYTWGDGFVVKSDGDKRPVDAMTGDTGWIGRR